MSRPEGYRKRESEEDDDQSHSSAEESVTSSEEEEEEERKETKKKKKESKRHKSKKPDDDDYALEDGDQVDVMEELKLCLADDEERKKIDSDLVQVCGANARDWRHPKFSGTQPLAYPEAPLKYVIDYEHIDDPEDIKVAVNGLKSSSYTWKNALEDADKRRFYSSPPCDVHLQSQVHQLKLTFALPGGDYQNLDRVCERILVASRKGGPINLSLSVDQKQQLFKMLGKTVDSTTTKMDTCCNGGYHMLIRAIAMTDYNNKLPISFGSMLITHDPITDEEKSWCNIKQVSNVRSSAFKGASAITIPACSYQRDIIEHMWIVPKEHYHPDVSRYLNVNYDFLYEDLQEMKVTGTARKVPIGPEPSKTELKEMGDKRITYSTYEIKMPELTAVKADNMIQFFVWQRYGDIILRTSAIPDITQAQIKLYTDYNSTISGYRLLCVVFDSIIEEYEPYMRHCNYLMSLDGEVTLALMPERPIVEIEQDIKNFQNDDKTEHYGPPPSITLQIEYETFTNNKAILPKSSNTTSGGTIEKEKSKKKEKKKAKSNKKNLLKKNNSKKSASIKAPKNRNDYMALTEQDDINNNTTVSGGMQNMSLNDPGMTTTTAATPPQVHGAPRTQRPRIVGLKPVKKPSLVTG